MFADAARIVEAASTTDAQRIAGAAMVASATVIADALERVRKWDCGDRATDPSRSRERHFEHRRRRERTGRIVNDDEFGLRAAKCERNPDRVLALGAPGRQLDRDFETSGTHVRARLRLPPRRYRDYGLFDDGNSSNRS